MEALNNFNTSIYHEFWELCRDGWQENVMDSNRACEKAINEQQDSSLSIPIHIAKCYLGPLSLLSTTTTAIWYCSDAQAVKQQATSIGTSTELLVPDSQTTSLALELAMYPWQYPASYASKHKTLRKSCQEFLPYLVSESWPHMFGI